MQPRFEVAGVIENFEKQFLENHRLPSHHLRTLQAIKNCRTQAMGGHIDCCDSCGHLRISYNSCRNRHCPKCQGTQREKWILDRQRDLLPVSYFHVVFTLPSLLNRLCMHHPKQMYNLLFTTAWQTLKAFSKDEKHLGAQTGMVSVLHTWGQNLSLHPHLHCIVPGGGLTSDSKWKQVRNNGKFLFPVKAMSRVFRAKYVAGMRKWAKKKNIVIEQVLFDQLFEKEWVVYAKRPFCGPQQVIEYLGRYTHKIAISNHRLVRVNDKDVEFRYKDYRQNGKNKTIRLDGVEFLRRFCQHILPWGFMRIRHYGLLSSRNKTRMLATARTALGVATVDTDQTTRTNQNPVRPLPLHEKCPVCKNGAMVTLMQFDRQRGPPDEKRLEKLVQYLMKQKKILKAA